MGFRAVLVPDRNLYKIYFSFLLDYSFEILITQWLFHVVFVFNPNKYETLFFLKVNMKLLNIEVMILQYVELA
jgi:hypothetical protein